MQGRGREERLDRACISGGIGQGGVEEVVRVDLRQQIRRCLWGNRTEDYSVTVTIRCA